MQKVLEKLNLKFGFTFPEDLLSLTFVFYFYRDTQESRVFHRLFPGEPVC